MQTPIPIWFTNKVIVFQETLNKSTPLTFVIIDNLSTWCGWTNKTFKKELHGLGKTKNSITNEN
jgi:hypothetical protein